ncbi:hypothetical protein BDB01DRAFT_99841 [Pilobolus umbonatus]|nr:hypothetical protein BDB01DRAFT_99841 [Pilobolus umbonatus]
MTLKKSLIAISTGIIFALVAIALLYMFKKHKDNISNDKPLVLAWSPSNRLLDATRNNHINDSAARATAAALIHRANSTDSEGQAVNARDEKDLGNPSSLSSISSIPRVRVSPSTLIPFSSLLAAAENSDTSDTGASENNPKLLYAKYPFKAREYGELSFEEGDPIIAIDTSDSVWWLGYKNDGMDRSKLGVFPSIYVKQ